MYRQYEDPYKIEKELEEAEKRLEENPDDDWAAIEVAELRDRLRFAWDDNEAEMEGYE
jgi:hypothetical protein